MSDEIKGRTVSCRCSLFVFLNWKIVLNKLNYNRKGDIKMIIINVLYFRLFVFIGPNKEN